ncbi:MAG: hypothetical protein JW839_08045 [Candidatus Lokiarchaeota archaeon]|nr:hypothetical protein [Candidatus Lokiarchaeota archaeon]
MNVFVLKGVLLDAGSASGTAPTLKDRVFESISFPGFINSTYDVIGVEFGLGIMELPRRDEPATVKIQIWNLNEQKNFILNWRHFLKGSRFGIITWNQHGDVSQLEEFVKDCLDKCPEINIGIVVQQDGGGDGDAGAVDVDAIPARLEKRFGIRAAMARDIGTMMEDLVNECLDNARAVHVLPVSRAADLAHVPSIQNPFYNYLTRVSDNLLRFLAQHGVRVEDDYALLENDEHVFRINLARASLHVASKHCDGCRERPCREAFTKVCVVLDSQIKRGFASEDLGFTPPDLFVLSMVFAIENGLLPSSVTSQFPKAKPCTRRK